MCAESSENRALKKGSTLYRANLNHIIVAMGLTLTLSYYESVISVCSKEYGHLMNVVEIGVEEYLQDYTHRLY